MSRLGLVLGFLVVGLGVGSMTLLRGEADRTVRLFPERVELGRLAEGSVVEQDYVLVNGTAHRVVLADLYRSCGCQEVWIAGEELAKGVRAVERTLEPGAELRLRMRLVVPDKVREFDLRWSGVEQTDQGPTPLVLSATVHVLGYREFWVEEEDRDLGTVSWQDSPELEWTLGSDDGSPFAWERAVTSPGLTSVRRGGEDEPAVVRGRFVPHRWGPQADTLRLLREDGRSVLATVRAVVPEPFVMQQRFLGLGEVYRSTELERELDLPLREGFDPPRSVRVEPGTAGGRCSVRWEQDRLLCSVDVGEVSGPFTAWIVFEWEDDCPPFRFPVHGYVR